MKATTARNTKPAQTGAAMNRFFTLEKANKGKVLDLLLPDGEKSGYSLTVVNRLSDVAAKGLEDLRRSNTEEAAKDEADRTPMRQRSAAFLAKCVIGWTLPEEFTLDNVTELLTQAPQIASIVETYVWNDSLFFAAK
jgi:hypothetical protein